MKVVTNMRNMFRLQFSLLLLPLFLVLVFSGVACKKSKTIKTWYYPSGNLKLHEEYQGEKPLKSIWYLPDGNVFRITVYEDETGTGYYLDDQGRVTQEIPYVKGVAHGVAFRFTYEGEEMHASTIRYINGVEQKE